MRVLLCIASNQTAANINPISALEPDQVVVAITQSMAGVGATLISEMKSQVSSVEALPIENETSLNALNAQFSAWLEAHIDDEIIVNITGGTKLMSLSAYQLFSSWGFRCFYCDKDTSQLIWLDDESTISDIGSKIGLARYLRMYQFQIQTIQTLAEVPKAHKHYARLVFDELSRAGRYKDIRRILSKVNAHTAQPSLSQHDLKKFEFSQEEEAFLSYLSQETQLFNINVSGAIKPSDEAARVLMNGGWLEVLTADSLRTKEKAFRDISLNVKIAKSTQRVNQSVVQEIDVMAMQEDTLVIVECKTKNWKTATEASEAIYKLSALKNISGLNTRAIFVSLYDLKPAAKTRAAEHQIQICSGETYIQSLRHYLRVEV